MTKSKPERPSLYAGSSAYGNAVEACNILEGLESAKSFDKSVIRVGLFALALLFGAGAFVAIKAGHLSKLPVWTTLTRTAPEAAVANRPLPSLPLPTVPAVSETVALQARGARIVVDDFREAHKGDESQKAQSASVETHSSQNDLPQITEKQIESPSSDHQIPKKTDLAGKHPEEARSGNNASVRKPAKLRERKLTRKNRPTASHAKQAQHPRQTKAGYNSDRDADLIAALLTRVSSAESTDKKMASRSVSNTTKQKAAPGLAGNVTKDQDVVIYQSGDPIEPLVKRCRALGLVEGELCRIRICSGHWGKDPACPAAAPSVQN